MMVANNCTHRTRTNTLKQKGWLSILALVLFTVSPVLAAPFPEGEEAPNIEDDYPIDEAAFEDVEPEMLGTEFDTEEVIDDTAEAILGDQPANSYRWPFMEGLTNMMRIGIALALLILGYALPALTFYPWLLSKTDSNPASLAGWHILGGQLFVGALFLWMFEKNVFDQGNPVPFYLQAENWKFAAFFGVTGLLGSIVAFAGRK